MYGVGIALVGVCWLAIQYQDMVGYVLGLFGGSLVLYVLFIAVVKLPSEERDRIFAAMFLILTFIGGCSGSTGGRWPWRFASPSPSRRA